MQKAKPGLAAELTPEKFRERDEACLKAVKDLGEALQKANADVVVVFGDDQQEQFHDENMPTFAIYHGKSVPVVKDNRLPAFRVEGRGAPRLGGDGARNMIPLMTCESFDSLAGRCRVRHRALQ